MAAITTIATTHGCEHDDDERSDALLGDIEPGMPLARYLRCPRSSWDFVHPAHTSPPPLLVDVDRFACYSDAKLPLLLRTAARIQQRSLALQSHLTRKAAFWTRVFPQHTRSNDLQLGVERWMFEHTAFPHIVLSFHQMEITAARLDMLLTFLTASDEDSESDSDGSRSECTDSSAGSSTSPHAPSLRPPKLPALGLRFTQCAGFGTESLKLLRQFLDRLFAHPRRRFPVHSLDLSHNQMNAAQLELLRDLLTQNARVYHIASVALNDIVFSRERESDEADALTTVLRVVFSDALVPQPQQPQLPQQALKCVSFDHASLRLQHFAAMCSAWRYGCDVVELSLLSTLNRVSAADRQQCWRWLAFGLFYPRSTRAAESFRLTKLDLSRIELRVADAKAFKQTLLDPASELVFHGQRPGSSGDGAAVVTLKRVEMHEFHAGASVFEHARATSRCVATLACDRALEVLATTADGWVCVVYPGVGLGWTLASHSMGLDNEASSGSTAADQNESDCSNKEQREHLFELTLHRLPSKKAPITTLVECIGRHARLLSLKYNTLDLAAIRLHCVHVAHLDIEGCHVRERSVAALVADTRFIRQLESLNLSDMALGDTDIRTLCQTLSSHEPSMRLRELRLVSDSMSAQGLASVRALLSVNKTLAVLELPRLSTAAAVVCREIDECHQDELLEIVKAQQTAVALLSVLSHASATSRGDTAQCHLDADSVASILTFAGAPVHRRILWRDSSSFYEDD